MTKNQIEYQKMQETRRANLASEALTARRDEASRRIGLDTLQETARHNQQVELQARDNLAEQYRNNVASLQELQRAHLASEGIAGYNAETQRQQQEEYVRHNQVAEALTKYGADTSKLAAEMSAGAHVSAAGISAGASQYASDNALMAKQLEIDLQKYGIDTTAGLRGAELSETQRSNIARETELNRSNVAKESLQAGGLTETIRHNITSDLLNRTRTMADISLRGEQNAIAQQQADTQLKAVDANISLIPSQKFANYTRGIQGLTQSAGSVVNLFKGKK